MSVFLDSFFATFDQGILEFFHSLALSFGSFLTPLCKVLDVVGDFKTSLPLYLAIILFLFTRHKKIGMMIGASLFIGISIGLLLKFGVGRMRPFDASPVYHDWWMMVGSIYESDFSFPSGHAISVMAAATAYVIYRKRPRALWVYAYVVLMCASRNYLMVHYPSDVLFGVLIGGVAALIANQIVRLLYYFFEKYPNFFFSRFVLMRKKED